MFQLRITKYLQNQNCLLQQKVKWIIKGFLPLFSTFLNLLALFALLSTFLKKNIGSKSLLQLRISQYLQNLNYLLQQKVNWTIKCFLALFSTFSYFFAFISTLCSFLHFFGKKICSKLLLQLKKTQYLQTKNWLLEQKVNWLVNYKSITLFNYNFSLFKVQ